MAYPYTLARSVKVYSPIRFANWASADSGTRTHTLAHKNLNLACLPIPSYLRTFTIIPSGTYPVKPFRSSTPNPGVLPPVSVSALPAGPPVPSPEQLRRRCDGSRKMLSPPGGEKTARCCFQLTPRHGCRVSATPHPAPTRIHFRGTIHRRSSSGEGTGGPTGREGENPARRGETRRVPGAPEGRSLALDWGEWYNIF